MKKILILAIALLSITSISLARTPKVKTTGIRQIVLVKFKTQVTNKQITSLDSLSKVLAEKVKPIRKLEWGKRIDEIGSSQEYDYCLVVEFRNETDMEIYQTNPLHLKFMGKMIPLSEKTLKFTYQIKK